MCYYVDVKNEKEQKILIKQFRKGRDKNEKTRTIKTFRSKERIY